MRSGSCRFTEFCNSQCLSLFAAPFNAARVEKWIGGVGSCKWISLEIVDVEHAKEMDGGTGGTGVKGQTRSRHRARGREGMPIQRISRGA